MKAVALDGAAMVRSEGWTLVMSSDTGCTLYVCQPRGAVCIHGPIEDIRLVWPGLRSTLCAGPSLAEFEQAIEVCQSTVHTGGK